MARESLTANTILVLFVIAFCGVFTILLAQWHQDTHHHHPKNFETVYQYEIGDICPDCSKISSKNPTKQLYCTADFAFVIWVESFHGPSKITSKTPSRQTIIRSMNHIHFQELQVFKNINNKTRRVLKRRSLRKKNDLKRNQVMIVNSTQACDMNNNIFEENTAYFVAGNYIDSDILGPNGHSNGTEDDFHQELMIITPCHLLFNWSDLPIEKRQDLSDYFKSTDLCSD